MPEDLDVVIKSIWFKIRFEFQRTYNQMSQYNQKTVKILLPVACVYSDLFILFFFIVAIRCPPEGAQDGPSREK